MTRLTSTLLGLALALVGCSRDPGSPPGTPRAPRTASYQFAGRGAFSHVERSVDADGSQQLRSETLISGGAAVPEAPLARLVESATLDGRGRLVRAGVCRIAVPALDVCFRFDASKGIVRTERGASAVEWSVPADAPWVYQGGSGARRELVSTPLSGWIAVNAALATDYVRVIEPAHERSRL